MRWLFSKCLKAGDSGQSGSKKSHGLSISLLGQELWGRAYPSALLRWPAQAGSIPVLSGWQSPGRLICLAYFLASG